MLENNFVKALLTLTVAGVWSAIIFQVMESVNTGEQEAEPSNAYLKLRRLEFDSAKFELLLNYTSPFVIDTDRVTPPLSKRPVRRNSSLAPSVFTQPMFKYHGLIKSQDNNVTGLLSDGAIFLQVIVSQKIGIYRVRKIMEDSIALEARNKIYYIRKR